MSSLFELTHELNISVDI